MKLSVKTLKGISFEIDVSLDDKISDVKKNIENTQGRTVYPADQQMLIYQGKVLSDNTVLNDHNVSEGSFMVVMLKKATVSSSGASTTTKTSASTAPTDISAPANPSTPLSAPAVTPPTTLSSVPSTTPTTAPENAPPGFAVSAPVPSIASAPAPGVSAPTEGDVYGQAASNLVAGSNFEGTVQQILEMGGGSWDRETVIRALRAAFNNPERAVDYLYSGIPAQAEAPAATQSPAIGQPVNPIVPVTQPSQPIVPTTGQPIVPTTGPNATGTPTSGPNANPLNLFGPNATGIPTSGPNANPLNLFPQGLPNLSANAGGNLDFLRDSPQFRTLQTMVQANPQILQPMLQELAKQNSQILRLIQEHQSEFLGMINEPVEGGDSNLLNQLAAALPQQQQITVTPEEHEAIERLEAMGFDRNLVLQVFFACNKNEELAANYLLDHMNEFDE